MVQGLGVEGEKSWRTGLSNFIELAGSGKSGALATFMPVGAAQPERFAWLAEPGLYQGNLRLTLVKPSFTVPLHDMFCSKVQSLRLLTQYVQD